MLIALTLTSVCGQAYGQKASNSMESCHHIAVLTESLLARTLWYKSKSLIHQPFFNDAAFSSFLHLSDEMKLYYTESQVKEMKAVARTNITELFHHHNETSSPPLIPPPLKDKAELTCDFVNQTHDIFLQNVPALKQMVFELIAEDSDFTLNHTLSLKAPGNYARNLEELRERWRKRIKFEKLVMAERFFGHNYPGATSTETVKDALFTRYEKLWQVRSRHYIFYWYWLKAFFNVIDSGASFLTHMIPSEGAVYVSTLPFTTLVDSDTTLSKMLDKQRAEIPALRPTASYSLIPLQSYPTGFALSFIKPWSYVLSISQSLEPEKTPHGQNTVSQKFLVLEQKKNHYEFAVKRMSSQTALLQKSVMQSITAVMEDDSGGTAELLYVKLQGLSLKLKNMHRTDKITTITTYLQQLIANTSSQLDVVMVDLRSSSYMGISSIYFFDMLTKMFVRDSWSLQKRVPLDFRRNLFRKQIVRSWSRHSPVPAFPEDLPLVILTDDTSKGSSEIFVRSMKLMNRALVLGSGLRPSTSGDLSFTDTAHKDGGHLHHTFTSGVGYSIDGHALTRQGLEVDIHLDLDHYGTDYENSLSKRPSYPWQVLNRDFFDASFFRSRIQPLNYRTFDMVSESMVAELAGLHQQRRITEPMDNPWEFSSLVSLKWEDFHQQISRNTHHDLSHSLSQFAQDYATHQRGQSPDKWHAISLMEQDSVLMEAIRITADYQSLLKKGRPASNVQLTDIISKP